MGKISPMMEQYKNVKSKHKDQILFFRLGDFYEMFYDDAILVSKELELTLTGRECGQEERAPMCGVPYHSAEAYIARLIKKGYKVAICEQMEDASQAKGLVQRDVIRVITPGTIVETSMLDEEANNFIASIYYDLGGFGVCFTDISTGEIKVTEYRGPELEQRLIDELGRFAPSEILFNQAMLDCSKVEQFIRERLHCSTDLTEDEAEAIAAAEQIILEHFHRDSLAKMALNDKPYCVKAIALLLRYLKETQKVGMERLLDLNYYNDEQFMNLSLTARRNLELTETMRSGEKRGSLLWVLDRTKTAMGKRLLRFYLEQPLVNPAMIQKRLNAVEELVQNTVGRGDIGDMLAGIFDLERLMTKVVFGNCTPRDLKALQATCERLPDLRAGLTDFQTVLLTQIYREIDQLTDVCDQINRSIREDPPVTIKEGGVIAPGWNAELDELQEIITHSKEFLANIEATERKQTGIPKLKIGYNHIFGYYIEVTRSYSEQVPPHYIRKQTLANCERYVTPELKELEEKILGANERIIRLEQQLFEETRLFVAEQLPRAQRTASAIARLDVFYSFAETAVRNQYTRPEIDLSDQVKIQAGRHPVVEALLSDVPFVANDTYLNESEHQIAIITGPNMAGKSTYMRQVALIVLMAQIGCFVPAASAHIGVVDGIFTRVGASDDLASGQSTFMVEMSEVAQILACATRKSLLILDEIGRGTSTFDGMSIARAVIEYIADPRRVGAKTLFATHYHELTEMEDELDAVKNYNVAVKKRGDDITFLRRIVRGGADDSYGIEVSKIAGIPDAVTSRAHEILIALEEGNPIAARQGGRKQRTAAAVDDGQTSLLPQVNHPLLERLKQLDVNTLTPIEALNQLYELKKLLGE